QGARARAERVAQNRRRHRARAALLARVRRNHEDTKKNEDHEEELMYKRISSCSSCVFVSSRFRRPARFEGDSVMVRQIVLVLVLVLAAAAIPASAQVDARMFRQPAVSADKIAFVYAGDIWLVPKSGGAAVRLSSPAGEESFPRFSPDGTKIAFSADYDGNTDVYVAPTAGGEPVRLTHHPMPDRVVGWHPDGRRVLFAS